VSLTLALPEYRLFPYERRLAEREIQALKFRIVERADEHFRIAQTTNKSRLRRLTYVARVHGDGHSFDTDIARFEAVHRERRGRTDTRQATRYHLHGMHEYKGKFNPQVARAFANLLDFEAGDTLLDPFCGCGTALVEGLALGGNTVGIDRSPLAVAITRAKLSVWSARQPIELAGVLRKWLDATLNARQPRGLPRSLRQLDAGSRAYLESWFPAETLVMLGASLDIAETLRPRAAQRLAKIAISGICRSVSYQLPEDLRVRRRPLGSPPPPAYTILPQVVENIILGLEELDEFPDRSRRRATAVEGSAATPRSYRAVRDRGGKCVVVTSPPYAMALPYIDTDRLSLLLLGLCTAAELRTLERGLYGSREWTTKEHRVWDERLDLSEQSLPCNVMVLCRREKSTTSTEDGFRRRATPALLYRYFSNMHASLLALRAALAKGEQAVLIVGENRTRAGRDRIRIETPTLLASIAETAGFSVREIFPLETWPRFGLHHTNGIADEAAVWLRAN
jgi:hypothetical protein